MKNAWVAISMLCSFLITACQETKIETSKPSSASLDSRESDQPKPADDKVIPPVPVTGVWLNAQVLKEKSNNNFAEIQIGVESFYNGIKVADQRDRFMVTLAATPNADNGASIKPEAAPNGEYDHIVTIQGTTLERIRAAYTTIGVYVTIVDRNDNTSDTWSTPLDAILNDSGSKTVVSSSSSASASTNSP
jgi:hypothetical protein